MGTDTLRVSISIPTARRSYRAYIYLVSHRNLLHKIQVLRCIVVFVLQKKCEACMLKSRVIVQALRWFVEVATRDVM